MSTSAKKRSTTECAVSHGEGRPRGLAPRDAQFWAPAAQGGKGALPRLRHCTTDTARLLRAAAAAARHAYAPYSRFAVGAALLTDDGRVFCGCNVENASYGLTICAERAAVCAAVAAGAKRFRKIAVVSAGSEVAMPCGACRQVLAEFAAPGFAVIAAPLDNLARHTKRRLRDLLPDAFHLDHETR